MSSYEIGAFEALEWAWHALRSYSDRTKGVDDARRLIQETLHSMGRGDKVDFSRKILEAEAQDDETSSELKKINLHG